MPEREWKISLTEVEVKTLKRLLMHIDPEVDSEEDEYETYRNIYLKVMVCLDSISRR